MSDLFPAGTGTIIGLQLAFVLIPIGVCLIAIGIAIGWWIWS